MILAALAKSYTIVGSLTELLGTTKGVLWNKGVQGTSASSLAGCTRSAQAADLKCLLCFIAVINLSSEIKSEGCC